MVCDRELVGFQRSFASGYMPENRAAFKRVARSALVLRAGALAFCSARFPLLFQERKHIGCTYGLRPFDGQVEHPTNCDCEADLGSDKFGSNSYAGTSMNTRMTTLADLPGMDRSVVLSFSNGWQPGELNRTAANDVAAAIELVSSGGWCWPPDESSNVALPVDQDILADHLRGGDPAFLINPINAGMVHLQPSSA